MDNQTQACHRLICSVINLAVRDLTLTPYKIKEPVDDAKGKRAKVIGYKADSNAISAFNFFFIDKISDRYLGIIGYDADVFKAALINSFFSPEKSCHDDRDRKNFRYNYFSWVNLHKGNPTFVAPMFNLGGKNT
jgi:hypothetical protein